MKLAIIVLVIVLVCLQGPYFYESRHSFRQTQYFQLLVKLLTATASILGSKDYSLESFKKRILVKLTQIFILLVNSLFGIFLEILVSVSVFSISICVDNEICSQINCEFDSEIDKRLFSMYFIALGLQLIQVVKNIESYLCAEILKLNELSTIDTIQPPTGTVETAPNDITKKQFSSSVSSFKEAKKTPSNYWMNDIEEENFMRRQKSIRRGSTIENENRTEEFKSENSKEIEFVKEEINLRKADSIKRRLDEFRKLSSKMSPMESLKSWNSIREGEDREEFLSDGVRSPSMKILIENPNINNNQN